MSEVEKQVHGAWTDEELGWVFEHERAWLQAQATASARLRRHWRRSAAWFAECFGARRARSAGSLRRMAELVCQRTGLVPKREKTSRPWTAAEREWIAAHVQATEGTAECGRHWVAAARALGQACGVDRSASSVRQQAERQQGALARGLWAEAGAAAEAGAEAGAGAEDAAEDADAEVLDLEASEILDLDARIDETGALVALLTAECDEARREVQALEAANAEAAGARALEEEFMPTLEGFFAGCC